MATAANFTVSYNSLLSWDNSTWQSPALSQLDWSDCAAITDYWAEVINIMNENDPNDLLSLGNLGKLYAFLDGVVPPDWPSPPNLLYTASWFMYVWENPDFENDTDYNAVYETLSNVLDNECRMELCEKLNIQGDPDVSGPGVSQPSHMIQPPVTEEETKAGVLG
ncbi:hypothetical protein SLS62_006871 [Diatrype stigma]|uniref:Uncharacterized protein n=1 Tax=Diatrype stigma TaxID=117547 RepID=A0AAN9YQU5_9PEZI